MIVFVRCVVLALCTVRCTSRNPVLVKVRRYILHCWPQTLGNPDSRLTPYLRRRNELSVVGDCVLWVPQGRSQVMKEPHEGHPGSSWIKSLAHGYVWWPGMNGLEKKVKECPACQSDRKMPPQTPLHSWEWPKHPRSRLHIDYTGPVMGRMLLIVVDSHSKWIEVLVTTSAMATTTMKN